MRHIAVILVAIGAILGAFAPIIVAFASGDNDNGHTPVTLCHWVPAHGGSFITITVDDDGSDGNSQLQAHLAHENDIIPAPEGGCDSGDAPTVTPTPDPTPTFEFGATPTLVSEATSTPTNTPFTDIGDPVFATPIPCVEDEVYDGATGECIHIDRIADASDTDDTEPIKLPSTGIGAE